ncbi:MAG TPA: right-handed parallel beta-helix repeat-containing protein [Acidimicrobiales bacterium]|nr:right-handed parallel beta-helix repeat-containing protein [Acidimicrobiales bacterium]
MSLGRIIRRSWRTALPIGILAAGLLYVAPATVSGALQSTLYVSPTGTDVAPCTFAKPCKTINFAISQATTNAVIHVAAGIYTQTVTVNKNVTIEGAGAGTILEPSTPVSAGTDPDNGSPTYAIVDVTPLITGKVENLSINGASASGFFTSCADDYVGVYFNGAAGTLDNVSVNNVELPTGLFGCQDGLAIYVDSPAGLHAKVTMSNDTVSNYDKNGITCDDVGTSCNISGATATGIGPTSLIAQNGIQAYHATMANITNSTVSQNSYTGGGAGNQATGLLLLDVGNVSAVNNKVSNNDVNVYLGSDGAAPTIVSWAVRGNSITNATDNVPGGEAGYGDGIQVDSITSTGLTLNTNTVTGSAENGISVLSSSEITVYNNTVESSGDNGIYVGGPGSFSSASSATNHVLDNKVYNNGKVGILADVDSTGNTFRGNDLGGNTTFDIEDEGTGNTFPMNSCPGGSSSPSGLCRT